MPGGVTTPQEFWDVLVSGRDMITEIPPDRWSIESFHDPDQSNHSKMVTKRCGFIHDIDKFDNAFFKVRNTSNYPQGSTTHFPPQSEQNEWHTSKSANFSLAYS